MVKLVEGSPADHISFYCCMYAGRAKQASSACKATCLAYKLHVTNYFEAIKLVPCDLCNDSMLDSAKRSNFLWLCFGK